MLSYVHNFFVESVRNRPHKNTSIKAKNHSEMLNKCQEKFFFNFKLNKQVFSEVISNHFSIPFNICLP